MAGALLDGKAENIDMLVQGDLDQFPFEIKQSESKPSGVFKITGNITGGKLDPGFGLQRTGHSAAWPKLEEIRGQIVLDKTNLKIHTDTARTAELNLSDVLVLPSYREGFPKVVMEAMAMGCPVVGYNVPGMRDAVSSGVTGFLVTNGDRFCCFARKIRLFKFGFVRNSPMFKVLIKNAKETYQNYGETVEPVWVDYYQLLKILQKENLLDNLMDNLFQKNNNLQNMVYYLDQ
jgi:glycosyltransferase involved in cell wall biosynthesis